MMQTGFRSGHHIPSYRFSQLVKMIQTEQKELSKLTDQELLNEAKKKKSASFINALFIGILIGVVIYSIAKNTFGFFTLIPLFFAYKLVKNSKSNKALEEELKTRNLK